MLGEPTEITEQIDRYKAGEQTLDELADWMAGHRFGDPPKPDGDLWERYANQDFGVSTAGTFDEVMHARAVGKLTAGDLQVIAERIHADR